MVKRINTIRQMTSYMIDHNITNFKYRLISQTGCSGWWVVENSSIHYSSLNYTTYIEEYNYDNLLGTCIDAVNDIFFKRASKDTIIEFHYNKEALE